MTDYTPTTEQVRNAYVRGMRDTFIASAGEHYEEFNRWMQAHDDEVRASVQPPTREQIAEALWESARQEGDEPVWTWQYLTERADRVEGDYAEIRAEYYRSADAMLALFPQPTPAPLIACPHWNNGGERGEVTMRKGCTACRAEARDAALVAEPVSIADLAPGTAVKDVRGVIWYRGTGSWVAANGPGWPLEPVAPVVVLDVTPPAGDAEGGALTNTPRQTREQIIGDLAEMGRQMFAPRPLADSLTIVAIRASYAEFQSTGDLHELARAVGNILKATVGTDE